MVVKFKNSSSSMMDSSKRPTMKHIGNDIKLSLDSNPDDLILVGNSARVKIIRNEGSVKIIGDSCKVNISLNSGSVNYVGNRGTVIIGKGSVSHDVKYTGNAGVLKYTDGEDFECKNISQAGENNDEKKKRTKKHSRKYNSDTALNINTILLNCNRLLTDYSVNMCSRSTESFVTSGTVHREPSISIGNGSVTINNYYS